MSIAPPLPLRWLPPFVAPQVASICLAAALAVAPGDVVAQVGPDHGIELVQDSTPRPISPDVLSKRRTRDLVAVCVSEGGSATGWCAAYLMGVADSLTALGTGGHKGGICNVNYTPEILSQQFLGWIRDNATMLDVDMLGSAMLAFRHVWPCR